MTKRERPAIDENPLASRFRVGRVPDPPTDPAEPDPAQPASHPASRPASQPATYVATSQATQQAGQVGDRDSRPSATTALRRRRPNPWEDPVQSGIRLPRFLREALRAEASLTGGTVEQQRIVARALYWYFTQGMPLELPAGPLPPGVPESPAKRLEEAWVDEGGLPGRCEEFRPR